MSTPERIGFPGPGGRLSALRWDGPADKPPVLFVHPVNTAAVVWREVAARLGRRAVAVDYRGHGSSGPGPRYLPVDYAADALAALDRVGWEVAHVVGGSIGGAVSVEITATARHRVASVGLFGATLGIGVPDAELAPMLAELAELGAPGWFAAHGAEILGPGMPASIVEALVEVSLGRDPDAVAQVTRTAFALADSRPAARSLTPPLPPALVAVGTHDPTCPLPMARELAGYLGTEAVTMPGIGHLPMLEAPDQVAALLVELHERADDRASTPGPTR